MRRRTKIKPRLSPEDWDRIDALIREDWSPEQISGRLIEEGRPPVSHEWIYQYIYADEREGKILSPFPVRRSYYS